MENKSAAQDKAQFGLALFNAFFRQPLVVATNGDQHVTHIILIETDRMVAANANAAIENSLRSRRLNHDHQTQTLSRRLRAHRRRTPRLGPRLQGRTDGERNRR